MEAKRDGGSFPNMIAAEQEPSWCWKVSMGLYISSNSAEN